MGLWRVKARLAKGRPFKLDQDVMFALLDAVWASLMGDEVGCTKDESRFLDCVGSTLDVDERGVVVFPSHDSLPLFAAIHGLAMAMMKAVYSPFPVETHFLLRLLSWWRRAKRVQYRHLDCAQHISSTARR